MYNRYIPQPDGSYRRNRMQDTHSQVPPPPVQHQQPPPPAPAPPPDPGCSGCIHKPQPRRPAPRLNLPPKTSGSVGGFLKTLLPKDFDMEDLLIVLLLLLMSGDCQEEQNTALLTLALYLFL